MRSFIKGEKMFHFRTFSESGKTAGAGVGEHSAKRKEGTSRERKGIPGGGGGVFLLTSPSSYIKRGERVLEGK